MTDTQKWTINISHSSCIGIIRKMCCEANYIVCHYRLEII
jgi:hypothetical protein